MFRRLILTLAAFVVLADSNRAAAAPRTPARDLADFYLSEATDSIFQVFIGPTFGIRPAAYYTYFYLLTSRYYRSIRNQLEALGYLSLANIVDDYAAQFAALGTDYAYSNWVQSLRPLPSGYLYNDPNVWRAYIFGYLANLYHGFARQGDPRWTAPQLRRAAAP